MIVTLGGRKGAAVKSWEHVFAGDSPAGRGAEVLTTPVARIGRIALFLIQEMGRMLLFLLATFTWLVRPPFRPLHAPAVGVR